jgi:4'-phosphopantetheinyl transferase
LPDAYDAVGFAHGEPEGVAVRDKIREADGREADGRPAPVYGGATPSEAAWQAVLPTEFGAGAVHVWRVATGGLQGVSRQLVVLPPDERAHARRFVFAEDRERFVTTRWFLRCLLGHYLRRPPLAIAFQYGKQGKPALHEPSDSGIGFNVSHSGAWSLIALATSPTVGVDVEWVREDVDALGVAASAFALGERSYLRSLDGVEQTRAFFRCWTQKEAYVKARGAGLSIPLGSFEVELAEPPGLRSLRGDVERAKEWCVWTADPASDHLGAVAIEGAGWEVQYFDGSALSVEEALSLRGACPTF